MSVERVHRYMPEEIVGFDAEDESTHPLERSDGTHSYHFTLGGITAQNRALFPLLRDHLRYEVPLCCPICKAGLGQYIFAKLGSQALSTNQQRKNRNTTIFGKSHYRRNHPVAELKSTPTDPLHAFESTSTPADQVLPKRFRAGPPPRPARADADTIHVSATPTDSSSINCKRKQHAEETMPSSQTVNLNRTDSKKLKSASGAPLLSNMQALKSARQIPMSSTKPRTLAQPPASSKVLKSTAKCVHKSNARWNAQGYYEDPGARFDKPTWWSPGNDEDDEDENQSD